MPFSDSPLLQSDHRAMALTIDASRFCPGTARISRPAQQFPREWTRELYQQYAATVQLAFQWPSPASSHPLQRI
eukprot:11225037-Alexandrium_andersonii.AAC.1